MNRFLKVVWCFLFATILPMASAQAGVFDLYYWTDAVADHQVGNYLNWDANYHSGESHTSPADAVPGVGNIAIVALSDSTAEINPTSNFAGDELINSDVYQLYVGHGEASASWPFLPAASEGHLVVNNATLTVQSWMTLGRVGAPGTSTVEINGGTLNGNTDPNDTGRNAIGENATASITLNELEVGASFVQSVWNTNAWTIVGWNAGANGSATLNDASTWNCVANDITIGYFPALDDPSTAANGVVTLNDASVLDMMGHGIVIGAENASGTLNLNGTSVLKAAWLNTWSHASSTSTLNFDGGTLVTAAEDENFYAQNGAGLARIQVMENGAKINTDGCAVGINVPFLDGDGNGGGLTKLGEGILTLGGGANTYTGDTLVEVGTLSITSNEMLAGAANLWIAAGAMLDLNFTGDPETVAGLYLAGVAQATGTWGATGSGATYIDDTFFSGTGMLLVGAAIRIPGDASGDGYVDAVDAAILAQHWGEEDSQTIGWEQGDFDGDYRVGASDAAIMAANWNPAPPPSEGQPVPEPSTIALLLGLILVVLPRRLDH